MNIDGVRCPHLGEDLVEPLKWPVQMNFDPARSRGDHLSPVLDSPALHEADTDRAHTSQLENLLEALVHRLRELLREKLVVEDAHYAARRDLAHRSRMPVVSEVGVHALNENTALRETLGVDLATDVEETDAASDVSSSLFDDAVSVYVGE